ncbi:hypothetical protein TEA_026801 [Camellia sinensis var. sinensis]|uniref:Uncharacterized protein n=1 Tax=Camellia sinensis var. sinensis TaxID=542762 RepID=A0A4S4EAE4_CAMSN|nr:hypothetical protein TEA_026801 [Camellia sinensis var. sinensis]
MPGRLASKSSTTAGFRPISSVVAATVNLIPKWIAGRASFDHNEDLRICFWSQITGEASVVRKALYQVASRLHDNPSQPQHMLMSSSSIYKSGGSFMNQGGGGPLMGVTSLMGPYGGYKSDIGVDGSLPGVTKVMSEIGQVP